LRRSGSHPQHVNHLTRWPLSLRRPAGALLTIWNHYGRRNAGGGGGDAAKRPSAWATATAAQGGAGRGGARRKAGSGGEGATLIR